MFRNFLALVVSGILVGQGQVLLAGDPPFPNELKYPNVVPPKYEFGTYGDAIECFRDPAAVEFLDNTTLFVADTGNHRIQKLSIEGKGLALLTCSGMLSPRGMTLAEANQLWVVAEGSHEAILFDDKGVLVKRFGTFGRGEGQFDRPKDIALHANQIVVADSGNSRIQVFDLDGVFKFAFGTHGSKVSFFDDPTSVAVDKAGFIYVADSGNNRIQKFDATGTFVKAWGTWGSHAGLFATPISIDIHDGTVYVADLVNHRLQAFNTDGKFISQWGRHPAVAHEGNGRVHYPSAIAASPSGNAVAVVESFENRCQIFSFESIKEVKQVDDSAWWEKATRFHYGTRVRAEGGVLAISEPDTHSVLLFDNSEAVPSLINRFGGQGNTFGRMVRPSGILITNAERGEFIASDSGNRRLQMFAAEQNPDPESPGTFIKNAGKFVKAMGPSSANLKLTEELEANTPFFKEPSAMAQDSNGNIYLCDPADHQVLVYTSQFKFLRRWGKKGSGNGEFNRPLDIAINSSDQVFIVDAYNFRVQQFDTDGKYVTSWGKPGGENGEFVSAFGIAIGKDDTIFVTDSATHQIQKFKKDGTHILSWGKWGAKDGEFYKPKGIAVDEKGRVIVVDFGNHRCQIFDQDGTFVSTFGIGQDKNAPGY